MNAFTLFTGLTLGVCCGVLRTRITELRETSTPRIGVADDGLLDADLTSDDPIGTWLDRYLTPPSH